MKKQYKDNYLHDLRQRVIGFFEDDDSKIILFGSRARGDNSPCSDVDISIIPGKRNVAGKITLFKEEIEDWNLPYKVDILNAYETSDDFRKQILKEGIIWKD